MHNGEEEGLQRLARMFAGQITAGQAIRKSRRIGRQQIADACDTLTAWGQPCLAEAVASRMVARKGDRSRE